MSLGGNVAPDNGGVVCYKDRERNTLYYAARGNGGYEHLVSPNNYESIGPASAYEWTVDPEMMEIYEKLPTCIGTSNTNWTIDH